MLTETQLVLDQMERIGVGEEEMELYKFFIHKEHTLKEILEIRDENGL